MSPLGTSAGVDDRAFLKRRQSRSRAAIAVELRPPHELAQMLVKGR
jgi:hypothetical protein